MAALILRDHVQPVARPSSAELVRQGAPVRRPDRGPFLPGIVRDALRFAALGRHHEEVPGAEARGSFALGTGDAFDSTALRDLTTGSYAFMPKRVHHFGLCKGETLLVEYGIGPLTINLLGAPTSGRR